MKIENIQEPGQWPIALVIVGMAITVASIAAGARPMAIAGIGIISLGIGEMINHPYREELTFDGYGRPNGKLTGHPRNPSVSGLIFDAVGAGLFCLGLVWFIVAE